jgi:HEPN domain-containing protein
MRAEVAKTSGQAMNVEEHITYWLDSAKHDTSAAESLFAADKYDWCLFIGHLVAEKTLKAYFVYQNDSKLPPKTHNLLKLAELSNLPLTEKQRLFLDEVNDFNLEVRYPEYRKEFYKLCTKQFAEAYFTQIKEFSQWLTSQIRSKE